MREEGDAEKVSPRDVQSSLQPRKAGTLPLESCRMKHSQSSDRSKRSVRSYLSDGRDAVTHQAST